MGAEKYYFAETGDLFLRPMRVRLRATIAAGGATITKSATRRQSDPDAAITGSGGTYTITGLPKGQDYHVCSVELVNASATQTVFCANVAVFDASAGTMTVVTRLGSTGAITAVVNAADLHLSFDVESGAYS